jgi:hypothetical protein
MMLPSVAISASMLNSEVSLLSVVIVPPVEC